MVMVVTFFFLRFRFHSGGLGVGGVFARRCLCLHNRPHVRNRPREDHMTAPMVTFGGKRRVASFRVAGVAFCDIPTCLFMTCRKPFCVAGAILLQGYQKMACIFPGQCSTLNVSIFICVAGAALQTCRVACFLRTALSGLRQVVTTCKLHGRRIRHRENVIFAWHWKCLVQI